MRRAMTGRLGRVVFLGMAALTGAACAADMPKHAAQQQAESVPRPEWRMGDRWVFRRTAGDGVPRIVTHQVVATTGEGYTIHIVGPGVDAKRDWTIDLGLVREALGDGTIARYEPPATYFVWPLSPAKTWAQEFQYTDGRSDGRYASTWKVGSEVEPLDTVAGRLYTLRIERFAGPRRLEAYWYNPRVRYWVRLEDYLRGYMEELVEFRSWSGS
jgi:hypothetical protein